MLNIVSKPPAGHWDTVSVLYTVRYKGSVPRFTNSYSHKPLRPKAAAPGAKYRRGRSLHWSLLFIPVFNNQTWFSFHLLNDFGNLEENHKGSRGLAVVMPQPLRLLLESFLLGHWPGQQEFGLRCRWRNPPQQHNPSLCSQVWSDGDSKEVAIDCESSFLCGPGLALPSHSPKSNHCDNSITTPKQLQPSNEGNLWAFSSGKVRGL